MHHALLSCLKRALVLFRAILGDSSIFPRDIFIAAAALPQCPSSIERSCMAGSRDSEKRGVFVFMLDCEAHEKIAPFPEGADGKP